MIGQLTVTATLAVTTTVRSPLTRLLSPPAVVAVAAAVTASPALARRKRSLETNKPEEKIMRTMRFHGEITIRVTKLT